MVQKAPSPTDKHVATRIRLRRLQLGMSQEELAGALRVTCQQMQIYEKGANRISAGHVQDMARILSVPIHFFYEDGSDATLDQEAARLAQA
jgi:transcriptional regulator with XRE-family HTH domain